MNRPEFLTEDHLVFLDVLRNTGATNMFGAAPYLMEEFPELKRHQAKDVVMYWMKTFKGQK